MEKLSGPKLEPVSNVGNDVRSRENVFSFIVQAVTEFLNKSHYANSHLQMRQNPISVAEHSGQWISWKTNIQQTIVEIRLFMRLLQEVNWMLLKSSSRMQGTKIQKMLRVADAGSLEIVKFLFENIM